MKNWINKYLLLLSMLLMVCSNHSAAYANSSLVKDAGKGTVSQSELQKHITSISSYSSAVFKKAEDRFTTNESSEEEEVSSSGKKLLKNSACLNTSFYKHSIPSSFETLYKKSNRFKERFTSFSPCRLYILLRVIRL